MARKPKNPEWKTDLEYFLSKGLPLYKACKYAQVNWETAKAHGYGTKRRLITEHHNEIVEMRLERKTYREIADILGFSANAIYIYCAIQNINKGDFWVFLFD